MDINERKIALINALSRHGKVEAIKEGYVFTLLLTGTNLSNSNLVFKIQHLVISQVGDIYPFIEVFVNNDTFLLMVLHPELK